MTCSTAIALFLVLFALATFLFVLTALYLMHTLCDGRNLKVVDMAFMFLSMLLLALNGFAAVCPCFDADGDYAELTIFWLPLFYGIFTVLCKLITFDVFRRSVPLSHSAVDAVDVVASRNPILSEHSVTVFQSLIAVTLCVVLITTAGLGSLTASTLSVYIVSLSVLHCATLFILIGAMKSIAQKSQNSPNRSRTRIFSTSKNEKQNVADHERDSANVMSLSVSELLAMSRVLRSAIASAVCFAAFAIFAIWLSAIWLSENEPSTTAVALMFFVTCSLGVFTDMICAVLLRTEYASPRTLFRASNSKYRGINSRWVPHNQRLSSEEEREDVRRMSVEQRSSDEQATPVTFEEQNAGDCDGALAEFGLTNSKRNIIIRYSNSKEEHNANANGQADDGSELDKYTKPTLSDPTSYTEVEKELDDLMEMELNKKSAHSEEL